MKSKDAFESFISYFKKRAIPDWMFVENSTDECLMTDLSIPKGKGFDVHINKDLGGFNAKIKFQSFAKELSAHVANKVETTGHPLAHLLEANSRLSCRKYEVAVKELFKHGTFEEDTWWLDINYRLKADSIADAELFADLLISILLYLFPYDVTAEEEGLSEGTFGNKYERSRVNRTICLAFHGFNCKACGINLREQYGEVARQFIHVHHLNPISKAGEAAPDPITDMVPLCPNCHGIAHRKSPPYSVEEIRTMIIVNNGRLYN